MYELHRKYLKRYDITGHAHALTFSSNRRQPGLTEPPICKWIIESIQNALIRHRFGMVAWVIMPEHIHLAVHPREESYSIAKFLLAIKQPPAQKAMHADRRGQWRHRERWQHINRTTGEVSFRLWQAGGGYDLNLFDRDKLIEKIEYIHFNPVRRGLCDSPEEWELSSYRDWIGLRNPLIPVEKKSWPR